jgi:protease-4
MMKLNRITAFLFTLSIGLLFGQSIITPYQYRTNFLLTSPGGLGVGLYGYDNPALLTYLHQPDVLFTWTDEYGEWHKFKRWALFSAVPKLGFSIIHESNSLGSITDYNISIGVGNKTQGIGVGYAWSGGDTRVFGRTNIVKLGYLLRPVRFLSVGLIGNLATSGGGKEGIVDLGIRPLGNEKLTLFADYAIQDGEKLKDGNWSAGATIEALPGIRFAGRYFNNRAFTFGLNFSLGRCGIVHQQHYNHDQEHSHNTYGIRLGANDRSGFKDFFARRKKYLKLELHGPIKYQRYALFDKSNTLYELISTIDAAKKDAAVSGIVVNASGLQTNQEILWELREKLKDFKSTGKHVVMFIDHVGMTGYHFASIADRIVIDPCGSIILEGFLFGRMYMKGTLEKIGIGVDELRFFKYKSAAEALSREDMSAADREQWQSLVDDYYELTKSEICASRSISTEKFDKLVNEDFIFIAKAALKNGLVDTIGRWESVKDMIERLEGAPKSLISPGALAKFQLPKDNCWGENPKIAIIYALGVCAMDQGITARNLVKDVEAVTDNSQIKAVVFRVDSPGGDATASDVVAEALKKCREKKPVIVSQGLVAGSGGYWLSMYGDTIVAAPNTITGSIGVIGFWLYNKALKEKLGLSTDFVKAGKHADLGFGFRFPFMGTLPDRDLNDEERAKSEKIIKVLYKDFVEKVASGRNRKYEDIEAVAQGRVWSGYDGKEHGLVDVLGGLETAIAIAKKKAGISEDQEVTIVELPKKGLIAPDTFTPKIIALESYDEELLNLMQFYSKHNGKPMPMLLMDCIGMIMDLRTVQ